MAINPNKSVKAVSLSDEEQLDILANGGSIPSGSDTYTADESTIYLTPKKPTVVTGSSAPTTSTVADFVGQFYLDTTTTKLYQCTAIVSGTPNTYTWTEVGGGSGKYMHNIYSFENVGYYNRIFTFSIVTNDSSPYTTMSQVNSAMISIYGVNKVLPVNGLYLAANSSGVTEMYYISRMRPTNDGYIAVANDKFQFNSMNITIDNVTSSVLKPVTRYANGQTSWNYISSINTLAEDTVIAL